MRRNNQRMQAGNSINACGLQSPVSIAVKPYNQRLRHMWIPGKQKGRGLLRALHDFAESGEA
jgi:hypothetical protein